ncbi:MAG: hypothetical protein NC120_12355 [Ruminococcus sp.]|nr:hypothetical protein [Ruminococcus sp.]
MAETLVFLLVWLMGGCAGAAVAVLVLYIHSRPSGALIVSITDPSKDFLSLVLNRDLDDISRKREITLKVVRK